MAVAVRRSPCDLLEGIIVDGETDRTEQKRQRHTQEDVESVLKLAVDDLVRMLRNWHVVQRDRRSWIMWTFMIAAFIDNFCRARKQARKSIHCSCR